MRQAPDTAVLEWAGQHGRIVVSVDKKTLAVTAWDRVAAGDRMPGVIILRTVLSIGQAIRELEVVALAGVADDLLNQVTYLPM